jgi:predicted N-acetyltransferase YhbS
MALATIRPLAREDLPAVAALLRAHLAVLPTRDVEPFLAATLFDDPWADRELPSLVAEDGGALAGFIARQPRRLELDGEPLQAVCCSYLTVAPEYRTGALAARLARAALDGPQRLTYSDAAGDLVVRLWRVLGGDVDNARSSDWVIALRPWRWLAELAQATARRTEFGTTALPLHILWRRTRRGLLAPEPGVRGERADVAALAAAQAPLTRRLRLRPVADAAQLGHVLATARATGRRVECRIVYRDDRPIGLWACLARPGQPAQVLAFLAHERDGRSVLAQLAREAMGWQATSLVGRLEPHLRDTVRPFTPALTLTRMPVMHARDDAVRAALSSSASFLPRLATEWWIP